MALVQGLKFSSATCLRDQSLRVPHLEHGDVASAGDGLAPCGVSTRVSWDNKLTSLFRLLADEPAISMQRVLSPRAPVVIDSLVLLL